MGCCGQGRASEKAPRYRVCGHCRGPVVKRWRYDAKTRRYIETISCPVCDPPAAPNVARAESKEEKR